MLVYSNPLLNIFQGTWRFMSMRMLNFDGDKLKHTFQDDMEALFYVVLFCALIYQGHDCPLRHVKRVLNNFFDEKMPFKPGIVRGGTGKRMNSKCRAFTEGIQYQDTHLGEWLNTVADLLRPADRDDSGTEESSSSSIDEPRPEPQDRWSDPSHLDVYWSTFLKTHTLAQNNRSEFKFPSQLEDETPSPLIFPSPPSPPLPSPGPSSGPSGRMLRKRPVPVSSDDARDTKRARRSGPGVPGTSGTRHSARLEQKMKRETWERETEKKRKEREAAKRVRAIQDKAKNAKMGRKGPVGTVRGGLALESTKRSSTRSTRKRRAVPGA